MDAGEPVHPEIELTLGYAFPQINTNIVIKKKPIVYTPCDIDRLRLCGKVVA